MIHGVASNLRAVERSDARFVAELLNHASVQTGWGTTGVPVSVHRAEQDVEHWLEIERTTLRPACLIVETLDNEPLGLIVVVLSDRINQSMVSLSIAIHPDRQDKGHGRDALSALTTALFDDWRIHRIQMICEVGNDRAIHLYESLGFRREATRVEATYMNGAFYDQHIYGLLSTDSRPDSG